MKRIRTASRNTLLVVLCLPMCSTQGSGPQTGSESHFLEACTSDCAGELECVCGFCTMPCNEGGDCTSLLDHAVCVGIEALIGAEICPVEEEVDGAGLCQVVCVSDGDCAALGEVYLCGDGYCVFAPDGSADLDQATDFSPDHPDADGEEPVADQVEEVGSDSGTSEPAPWNRCPTAVARGRVHDTMPWTYVITAALDETVELDGSYSYDDDGEVVAYSWTLVDLPEGSTATLEPNATVGNPTLVPDVAGDYTMWLNVIDDGGRSSCEQDGIQVTVPDWDIYVEVVWTSPDAPLPEEGGDFFHGDDLDLHFLHPDGDWDESPYDCNWKNRSPNWGGPSPPDVNPQLFVTSGGDYLGGIEALRFDNPQGTEDLPVPYSLGVFAFSTLGPDGPNPTVRIWIRGERRFEVTQTGLLGGFWDVARITWPSGDVERIHRLHSDFP